MKHLRTLSLVLSIVYALPWVVYAQGTGKEASRSRLEMRVVADGEYDQNGVKFDLAQERERLERWLDREGNREQLLEDPTGIEQFNRLPAGAGGPMVGSHLAWYPQLVGPGQRDPNDWSHRLVPINMHEEHFSSQDFDASKFRPTTDASGRLGVAFTIRPERADAYANWSARYTDKTSAIIVNGIIRSTPVLQEGIRGRGVIVGDFEPTEIDDLVRVLRGDTGPAGHLWVARVLLIASGAAVLLFVVLACSPIRQRLQAALPVPAMRRATRIAVASAVFIALHVVWLPLLPRLVPELDRLVISQSYTRMERLRTNLRRMRDQMEASRKMGDVTESELVYYRQVVQQGEQGIQQWSKAFSMPTARREIYYRAVRDNWWLLAFVEVGFLGAALSVWRITPRRLPNSSEPNT